MVYRSFPQPLLLRKNYLVKPKAKYPSHWKQFSWEIRFGRARGLCEMCGFKHGTIHPASGKVAYLTTAHKDYPSGICTCFATSGIKCCEPSHVLALCLRCHAIMMRSCSCNPVIIPPDKLAR